MRWLLGMLAVGVLSSAPPGDAPSLQYSRREIRRLGQSSVPADHERLAAYYRQKAGEFRQKEEHERQRVRELEISPPVRYSSKYPNDLDIARRLADYYLTEARKADGHAVQQQHIADSAHAPR